MTKTLRALATAAVFFPAVAWAQSVTRGPYVQMGAPDSMVVAWRTGVATDGIVRFGTSPQALTGTATDAGSRTQHEVRITGLQPDTVYYYDVGTAAGRLAGGDPDHFFRTSPAAGEPRPLRAWILGDDGTGASRQAQVQDAALAWAGARKPDVLLHLGDMAYDDGTEAEFSSKFFAPHQAVLRNTVVWPAIGNHEGRSADSATETGPYYDAYVLPRAGESGGLPSGTEAYYSFDWGNAHFVVLDSQESDRRPGSAMLTWLDQDLAATGQEWIVAYWHHPPYSKGSHDSDTENQLIQMRENALPILEAHGVDLVLAGHSHVYERSYLIDGAYDTPTTAAGHVLDGGDGRVDGTGPYQKLAGQNANDGAVYIVAGHGGANLGQDGEHPVMFFTEMAHGSTFLDLERNTVQVTNVRWDGVASDRFAMIKGDGFILGAPNGGEQLGAGSPFTVRWTTGGQVPDVKLEWSGDGGAIWETIVASTPNTGTYGWTVPQRNTSGGLVRVSAPGAVTTFDTSDASFSISGAVPEPANAAPVLDPLSGATIPEGQPLELQLSASDADGDVLAYSAAGLPPGATLDAATGAFAWTPTFLQAGTYEPTFTVSDGTASASQAMAITVTEVATGRPDLQEIRDRLERVGQRLGLLVRMSDPDADRIASLAIEGPPLGSSPDPGTVEVERTPVDTDAFARQAGPVATEGGEASREETVISVLPGGEGPAEGEGVAGGAAAGGCSAASGAGTAVPLLGLCLASLGAWLRRRRVAANRG